MSAAAQDADGDSQMDQITSTTVTTDLPGTQTLSPPLQTPPRNPAANANGKRPLNTISNGHDEEEEEAFDNAAKEENDDSMGSDMDPQTTSANTGNNNTAASSSTTTAAPTSTAAGSGAGGAGKERQEFKPKVHAASGYTWTRPEDEPGASWLNKKAIDENVRAVDSALHKECVIKGKYGDPFEMAEKEAAMQNSLAKR